MTLTEALLLARQAPPIPPGADPNSTESRVPEIYGFIGGFVPVAFVILSLRLYSRWKFTSIGKDDILVVISFILYLGLTVATVLATRFGLGKHIWTISFEDGVSMQKCGFTSQVLYPPALCAIKLSIVFFFIRCLPAVHERKLLLYAFAIFIFVEETAFTIALFLQCRPLPFYWDKTIEGGTCFNQPAFYYADAVANLVTDIGILSLPWILFRKLNVSKRQRYLVVGICSLGVFTLVASILRLPYLHDLNQSQDPTWSVPNIVVWTTAEVSSAISLSSIPATRPLWAFLKGKKKASTNGSEPGSSPATKKPRRTRASSLPFSFGTIGSIADRSRGIHMFTIRSDRVESQIITKSSESQDHIAAEEGKSQMMTVSTNVSMAVSEEDISVPQPALAKK